MGYKSSFYLSHANGHKASALHSSLSITNTLTIKLALPQFLKEAVSELFKIFHCGIFESSNSQSQPSPTQTRDSISTTP